MAVKTAGRGRAIVQQVERILGHLAAVLVGFTFMVIGLGLGVTMIMLPVGLLIGLVGVLVFVWGLFGHLESGNRRQK